MQPTSPEAVPDPPDTDLSPRGWVPWGLVGALVLLLAAEVCLRVAQPEGELNYGMSERAYRVFPYELESRGAARVSIVGSSRAREAVSVPTLRKALRTAGEPDVEVASYALVGARAAEVQQVVHKLIETEPAPELVLYGVGPRQLLHKARPHAGASNMWRVSDWATERLDHGKEVDRFLGRSVRNSLGEHLFLVRYEPQIRAALDHTRDHGRFLWEAVTISKGHDTSPMRGNYSVWQSSEKIQVFAVDRERARSYLAKVTSGEPYALEDESLQVMEETLEALSAAGIDVALFEVPIKKDLEDVFPEGTIDRFHQLMRELASRQGVPYLDREGLGLKLVGRDFREQSHLNLRGGRKTAQALAQVVVLPWLDGEAPASGQ